MCACDVCVHVMCVHVMCVCMCMCTCHITGWDVFFLILCRRQVFWGGSWKGVYCSGESHLPAVPCPPQGSGEREGGREGGKGGDRGKGTRQNTL